MTPLTPAPTVPGAAPPSASDPAELLPLLAGATPKLDLAVVSFAHQVAAAADAAAVRAVVAAHWPLTGDHYLAVAAYAPAFDRELLGVLVPLIPHLVGDLDVGVALAQNTRLTAATIRDMVTWLATWAHDVLPRQDAKSLGAALRCVRDLLAHPACPGDPAVAAHVGRLLESPWVPNASTVPVQVAMAFLAHPGVTTSTLTRFLEDGSVRGDHDQVLLAAALHPTADDETRLAFCNRALDPRALVAFAAAAAARRCPRVVHALTRLIVSRGSSIHVKRGINHLVGDVTSVIPTLTTIAEFEDSTALLTYAVGRIPHQVALALSDDQIADLLSSRHEAVRLAALGPLLARRAAPPVQRNRRPRVKGTRFEVGHA